MSEPWPIMAAWKAGLQIMGSSLSPKQWDLLQSSEVAATDSFEDDCHENICSLVDGFGHWWKRPEMPGAFHI